MRAGVRRSASGAGPRGLTEKMPTEKKLIEKKKGRLQ